MVIEILEEIKIAFVFQKGDDFPHLLLDGVFLSSDEVYILFLFPFHE